MSAWISFQERLPTRRDANDDGEVELLETNGSIRTGLWDWITPRRPEAVEYWQANGFSAWRRL